MLPPEISGRELKLRVTTWIHPRLAAADLSEYMRKKDRKPDAPAGAVFPWAILRRCNGRSRRSLESFPEVNGI